MSIFDLLWRHCVGSDRKEQSVEVRKRQEKHRSLRYRIDKSNWHLHCRADPSICNPVHCPLRRTLVPWRQICPVGEKKTSSTAYFVNVLVNLVIKNCQFFLLSSFFVRQMYKFIPASYSFGCPSAQKVSFTVPSRRKREKIDTFINQKLMMKNEDNLF